MTKTTQQIVDDGHFAKRLLDDVDFQRFLGEIEGDYWEMFNSSSDGDIGGREAIFYENARNTDGKTETSRMDRQRNT